jgi:hypothetical protein
MVQDVVSSDGVTLFVDAEAARLTVEDLLASGARGDYDQKVRPFLRPLRAVGASMRTDPDGATHAQVVLKIRK